MKPHLQDNKTSMCKVYEFISKKDVSSGKVKLPYGMYWYSTGTSTVNIFVSDRYRTECLTRHAATAWNKALTVFFILISIGNIKGLVWISLT